MVRAHPVKVLTGVTVLLLEEVAVAVRQQRASLTTQVAAFTPTAVQGQRLRFRAQAFTEVVVERARQAVQAALAAGATPEPQEPSIQAGAVVECQVTPAQQVQRAVRAW